MLKNIWKVFSSNLFKVLSTIIVTFFLPKFLSIDDYAAIKTYQLYVSYIGVSSLGYNDGIFLKYGGKKISEVCKTDIANEQTTLIFYQMALTILICVGALFAGDNILFCWGLSFFPTIMFTYYTYMYQATGEFTYYAQITNINSLMTLAVNSILLLVLGAKTYLIYISAYCAVLYLVFFFAMCKFRKHTNVGIGKFSFSIFYTNVKSGILLMIGNLVYIFFVGLDKWFVKVLFGTESFAVYSFAAQLLTAINMFVTPISLTLFSYFGREKRKDAEKFVKECLMILLIYMMSFVYIFRFIVETYIQNYVNALEEIVILFASQIFMTLNIAIYVNLFKVYKLQKSYFINLIIVVILSFGLNLVGCYIFKDTIGVALATLCCMVIWTFLNMKHFKHTNFKIKEIGFILGSLITYFVTIYYCKPIVGLGFYLLVVTVLFGVLRKEQFEYLIGLVKKTINFYGEKHEKNNK